MIYDCLCSLSPNLAPPCPISLSLSPAPPTPSLSPVPPYPIYHTLNFFPRNRESISFHETILTPIMGYNILCFCS